MQAVTLLSPFDNPFIRFITDNRYRWLRYALFLSLGLILAFKGDIGSGSSFPDDHVRNTVLMVDALSFVFINAVIYFLIQVLIPRLLFRSKLRLFGIAFAGCVIVVYLWVWFLDYTFLVPVNPARMQHVELSLLHFIQVGAVCTVLLGAVVGLKVFKKWIIDVQQMNELQETNLRTELEQLKSQVNPHFLFNTLNNLLVLTKTDADKASQVLLGLSDLLRYQLYDSATDRILLKKDIAFLRNLLHLENIRKTDFEYKVTINGNIENISIPPFLFIPFVENAIKHGASTVGHSYLNLHFDITDHRLEFRSENSKPPVKRDAIGGLGLKNIQRRLELLYHGKHTLTIVDNANSYLVTLIIPI